MCIQLRTEAYFIWSMSMRWTDFKIFIKDFGFIFQRDSQKDWEKVFQFDPLILSNISEIESLLNAILVLSLNRLNGGKFSILSFRFHLNLQYFYLIKKTKELLHTMWFTKRNRLYFSFFSLLIKNHFNHNFFIIFK